MKQGWRYRPWSCIWTSFFFWYGSLSGSQNCPWQLSLGIEPPMSSLRSVFSSKYTGNRTHDSGVRIQSLSQHLHWWQQDVSSLKIKPPISRGEDIAHDLAYEQVSSSDKEVCLGFKTTRQQSLGIEPPMSFFSNYTGNRTHDSGVSIQSLKQNRHWWQHHIHHLNKKYKKLW